MPITASCGNCGKTYQAPDRMAGKTVRCKDCGNVFRIDADDAPLTTQEELDLDELERSFGGDPAMGTGGGTRLGTRVGTHVGPTIDARGKASIPRDPDAGAFDLDEDGPTGFRTNLRYRYPGAKQIDQFLPWALVALTLFVIIQSCLNTESTSNSNEKPPTGVAVSRATILIALYAIVVWPASHLALSMAAKRLRFAMPRAPLWRSLAGFSPVLMLGGGLFILSGGETAALVMGLVVGISLAIGAVAILFRVFSNELPIVGGYTAAGSAIGSVFSIALIIAVNLIGLSVARSDANPTLFVSPIAVGMPWVEKPAPPVAVRPTINIAQPAVGPIVAADPRAGLPPLVAGEVVLERIPLAEPHPGERQFLVALEATPVRPGFDSIISPPIAANGLAIVRTTGGGTVETWDRITWQQPTTQVGKGFDASRGTLVVTPSGKRVMRLVREPSDRIEEFPLGNAAVLPPTRVASDNSSTRAIVGFIDEQSVLVSVLGSSSGLSLEVYDVIARGTNPPTNALGVPSGETLNLVRNGQHVMRVLPDGKSLLLAGRVDEAAVLLRYSLGDLSRPTVRRMPELNNSLTMSPLALSVNADGTRAALMMNLSAEAYLSIWNIRDPNATPTTTPTSAAAATSGDPTQAVVDRSIGLLSGLRPDNWIDSIDPVIWLDDHTLLVYGQHLVDADTGRRLGSIAVSGVRGTVPGVDSAGRVLLIVSGGESNRLIRATFDKAAIRAERGG